MRARSIRLTAALCVLGLTVAMAGCAEQVARRPDPLNVGTQGAAWDVVLPSPATGAELAYGPEQSRRDDALNYRDSGAPVVSADWPDVDRPSLDDARRLFIGHRADEVIYFSPGYNRGYYRWR